MGDSKRKLKKELDDALADIQAQVNEPDAVQIPLQVTDGWYRGIDYKLKPKILELWAKHRGDRQLLLYRIDRYWVTLSWETPNGSLIHRGDLMIEISTNRVAKEIWLNTVTQPHFIEDYRDQIQKVREGKHGSVEFWWFVRYLYCRKHLGLQSQPVNYWDIRPIIEIHHPDGTVEDMGFDLDEFLSQPKIVKQDPKKIAAPAPWELEIFRDCIKEEIVK